MECEMHVCIHDIHSSPIHIHSHISMLGLCLYITRVVVYGGRRERLILISSDVPDLTHWSHD